MFHLTSTSLAFIVRTAAGEHVSTIAIKGLVTGLLALATLNLVTNGILDFVIVKRHLRGTLGTSGREVRRRRRLGPLARLFGRVQLAHQRVDASRQFGEEGDLVPRPAIAFSHQDRVDQDRHHQASGSSTSSSPRSFASALRRAATGSAIASVRPITNPFRSSHLPNAGYACFESARKFRPPPAAARFGVVDVKRQAANRAGMISFDEAVGWAATGDARWWRQLPRVLLALPIGNRLPRVYSRKRPRLCAPELSQRGCSLPHRFLSRAAFGLVV